MSGGFLYSRLGVRIPLTTPLTNRIVKQVKSYRIEPDFVADLDGTIVDSGMSSYDGLRRGAWRYPPYRLHDKAREDASCCALNFGLCDNCGVVDPMFNYSPGKFKP